jgi:aspartate-semialdehyde dehydrogenase
MSKDYVIGVVGATGLVGEMIIKCLEKTSIPIRKLKLFASEKSLGKKIKFKDQEIDVLELTKDSFSGIDILFFAVLSSLAKEYVNYARNKGVLVIDNSSAFRMEKGVPLIVPEVNGEDLVYHQGIIANPNCSTIQLVVALNNIHKEYKIKKIIVSTYQAVSGAGKDALLELESQIEGDTEPKILPIKSNIKHYKIAYNVIPQVDEFLDNNYTKEEMKMVYETQKIFKDPSIEISATCVRVPVKVGHSESIYLETEKPMDLIKLKSIINSSKGVILIDNPKTQSYPVPRDVIDSPFVYVGRVRMDLKRNNACALWVVSNNLLKGAALNAVQIAELLISKNLLKGKNKS